MQLLSMYDADLFRGAFINDVLSLHAPYENNKKNLYNFTATVYTIVNLNVALWIPMDCERAMLDFPENVYYLLTMLINGQVFYLANPVTMVKLSH